MEYKVHISGLVDGKYEYEFPIGKELFEEYDSSLVEDAHLTAKVVLEKGSGWMNVNCDVTGTIVTLCDRCLEPLELPMNFASTMAVKHAKLGEETEVSDEFIIVDHSDGELDLKQFLYDNICINIPLRKTHRGGECNPQMIKKLESLKGDGQTKKKETYSPFENLKEMMKKR